MKKAENVPIALLPIYENFSDAGKVRMATIEVVESLPVALVEIDGMQAIMKSAEFLVCKSWAENNTGYSCLTSCMIGDF